jgi:Inhibitor of Apoptosis domain/Zinc finger, C3HC4 type (RING finger)
MERQVLKSDLYPSSYFNISTRLQSFSKTSLSLLERKLLAKSGFINNINYYKCVYCDFILKKINTKDLKRHDYSLCPLVQREMLQNINFREKSFDSFRKSRIYFASTKKELALNGFYYFGRDVQIVCCYCNLFIVKLSKKDCAERIHRKWSPQCYFNRASAPVYDESNDVVLLNDVSSESQTSFPQNLYPVLTATTNVQDEDTCKICFEQKRQICFFPCKHVCVCDSCSMKCKNCCICRERITGKLRIFLQ